MALSPDDFAELERHKMCDKCHTFIENSNFARHMKEKHSNSDFACEHCGSSFKRKDNLKRHIVSRHTASKRQRREEDETVQNMDLQAAAVTNTSDQEDVDAEAVPDDATQGTTVAAVGDVDETDPFNEPKTVIPSSVWGDIEKEVSDRNAMGMIVSNWAQIHSYMNERDPRVKMYNYRLIGGGQMTPSDYLDVVFLRQQHAFRIKGSLHLILQHKVDKRFRFFYASNNNFTLQVPNNEDTNAYYLIEDEESCDAYKEALTAPSMRDLAMLSLPNTEWKVSHVVGLFLWVVTIPDIPIG